MESIEKEIEFKLQNEVLDYIQTFNFIATEKSKDDDLFLNLNLFFTNTIFSLLNTQLHPSFIISLTNHIVIKKFDELILNELFEFGKPTTIQNKGYKIVNSAFKKMQGVSQTN